MAVAEEFSLGLLHNRCNQRNSYSGEPHGLVAGIEKMEDNSVFFV